MAARASAAIPGFRGVALLAGGDPFGTDPVCDPAVSAEGAVGYLRDRETGRSLGVPGACAGAGGEHPWPLMEKSKGPAFALLYERADAIVDESCVTKAREQLVLHGFREAAVYAFGPPDPRSLESHFWQPHWNEPLVDFFAAQARPMP
jgi:hypothetical protein